MTNTEIIEAAFKVWGRNFYRKTSLSQLALELKVSKPALYRHFLSKHALIEAMTERFFDDFAAAVRPDFEQALFISDEDDEIFTIVQSISGFFARNVYALIFSLVNIYDQNMDSTTITESLKSRGADLSVLAAVIEKKYGSQPPAIRIIFATLTFFMMHFHRTSSSFKEAPSDESVNNIISTIIRIIKHGLGYSSEKAAVEFEKLEKQVEEIMPSQLEPAAEHNGGDSRLGLFFRAIA